MAKTLNREQLAAIRDSFLDFNQASRSRRDKLENDGRITSAQSERIGQLEDQLRLIANHLNDDLLRQVLADIDQPGNRIKSATDALKEAVNTLKSLSDFVGVLSAAISLATTILTAFTSGNPLVLANILDTVEALI
jgi:hypothetical protein